ncbi:MAG: L-aspartate oxidase [Bacteroidota bacterium]
MHPQRFHSDFLVIGCGVAGLSFALKAARHHKVIVLTKTEARETNTRYAQGGIASVTDSKDSFEQHVADTLDAGAGLCNEEVVRMVVEKGPKCIQELIDYGANFDRNEDGTLMLGREGGHSANRILHSKDATGQEIQRTLLEQVRHHPNIQLLEHFFAIDFLTQHHLGRYVNRGTPGIECYGVYAQDLTTRKVHTFLSRITVLAAGGAGNVYASTTNPVIATGDGIAMAYRAKARVANMEFNQFHPTSFYDPETRPAFLITEALRGKGAVLRHPYTKAEFMGKYDPRGSLAPRDIVARAIDQEMKSSGMEHVYLDATHIPSNELSTEFPTIYKHCLQNGVDITKELIPVRPASHYICGGIQVDMSGLSSLKNLYACGECTCSGLHGANRLASNSLLEGVVFADNIYYATKDMVQDLPLQENVPDWNEKNLVKPEEWVLISHNFREVQNIMSNYVGIVRSNLRLERAARRIDLIYQETEAFYQQVQLSPELCELRNIIAIAYLIVKSASLRHESRGLHYTTDFPEKAEQVWETVL